MRWRPVCASAPSPRGGGRGSRKEAQEQQKGDGDKVAKETSTSTESLVTTDVGAVSNHGSSSTLELAHGWGSDALSLMLDAAEFSTLF
ncbi:hypothetical protein MCOR02_000384 [Pyricularia oryzae]|nr:hypothetical protein MCOR02_000384 [Pyricularia oryzae]